MKCRNPKCENQAETLKDCRGSNLHLVNTRVCSQKCYETLFVPGEEILVTPEELSAGGTRADKGKSRVDLIPADVLLELGKLYEIGARKYSEHNWTKGMDYSRMYASALRHLLKWWAGEEMDPDGFHHLDAVIWGAVGLRYFLLHPDEYDDYDDRLSTMSEQGLKDTAINQNIDNETRASEGELSALEADGEKAMEALRRDLQIQFIIPVPVKAC